MHIIIQKADGQRVAGITIVDVHILIYMITLSSIPLDRVLDKLIQEAREMGIIMVTVRLSSFLILQPSSSQ